MSGYVSFPFSSYQPHPFFRDLFQNATSVLYSVHEQISCIWRKQLLSIPDEVFLHRLVALHTLPHESQVSVRTHTPTIHTLTTFSTKDQPMIQLSTLFDSSISLDLPPSLRLSSTTGRNMEASSPSSKRSFGPSPFTSKPSPSFRSSLCCSGRARQKPSLHIIYLR